MVNSTVIPAKSLMSSFAFNPFEHEVRENLKNGIGFLDQSHQLARECAQNIFLSIDFAKYPKKTKTLLYRMVRDFEESLPEGMVIDKIKLKEVLDKIGHENAEKSAEGIIRRFTIDDEPGDDSAALEKNILKQRKLHLLVGDRPFSIQLEIKDKESPHYTMHFRMIGTLSGFGQLALHLPEDISAFLQDIFPAAAEDDGVGFVQDLYKLLELCPEKHRNKLEEIVGISSEMEIRLKQAIEQNAQQLYLIG